MKADPNRDGPHNQTLRWKRSGETTETPGVPAWLTWLAGLFRWVNQSARLLAWIALAGLALMLGVIVRLVRTSGVTGDADAFVPPAPAAATRHRPETLPAEIERRLARSGIAANTARRWRSYHRGMLRARTSIACPFAIRAPRAIACRWRPTTWHSENEYLVLLMRVWQRFVKGRRRQAVRLRPLSRLRLGTRSGVHGYVPAPRGWHETNRVIWLAASALLGSCCLLVATHTYWPIRKFRCLKGGADQSVYAVQRFANGIGARATTDRVLSAARGNAIIVLSGGTGT